MNNDAAITAWARQDKPQGRGNGAVSFAGPVLRSYATPVAEWVDTPAGRVALVTVESYSVTTAKHVSRAAYSAGLRGKVFRVRYLLTQEGRAPRMAGGPAAVHAANLADMLERAAGCRAKAARARTCGEFHTAEAERLERDARAYAEAFGLQAPGAAAPLALAA